MSRIVNVVELYSGLGGTHLALSLTEIPFTVKAAYEINTTANLVYRHNFPNSTLMQRNINSLTVEEMDDLNADLWTMSPPCQPFTRLGKQNDINDSRTNSFQHLLEILPKLQKPPRYIFLENVKGFETSEAHSIFKSTLQNMNYSIKEFMLTPKQFGIPNSRLRYYALARLSTSVGAFNFENSLSSENILFEMPFKEDPVSYSVAHYLEDKVKDDEYFHKYLVSDDILLRFSEIFDIVSRESQNTCCFTKGYSHYVQGTGSVITFGDKEKLDEVYKNVRLTEDNQERIVLLKSLGLRWFTPREVANLMGFPPFFEFPESITDKQCYRLLGNSINIAVVSKLLKLLLSDTI